MKYLYKNDTLIYIITIIIGGFVGWQMGNLFNLYKDYQNMKATIIREAGECRILFEELTEEQKEQIPEFSEIELTKKQIDTILDFTKDYE